MKKRENNLGTVRFKVIDAIGKTAFLVVLLIIFGVYRVSAQPCDPFVDPEDQPNCGEYNPDDVPIDGGASLLIAAGVAYGLKRVHDKRKQNKETDIA